MLDRMDRKILDILQKDCTMPVAEIGKQIGLSTTPCWRRIQKLEESGVIQRRVALLDSKKVNVGVTVFVSITTSHHTQEWLEKFHEALKDFPEVAMRVAEQLSRNYFTAYEEIRTLGLAASPSEKFAKLA